MQILDSFASDLFERIATEAVKLLRLTGKKTLGATEIQTAARLILPGELSKHAIQDGAKAVAKFKTGMEPEADLPFDEEEEGMMEGGYPAEADMMMDEMMAKF
eukprot:GSA120T00022681001.1